MRAEAPHYFRSDSLKVAAYKAGARVRHFRPREENRLPQAGGLRTPFVYFFLMSLDAPSLQPVNGAPFSIGIVASRYNPTLVDALVKQVQAHLIKAGVKPKKITVIRVPGANELPSAAQLLLTTKKLDVVVALGVIIRGDTIHYQLVAESSQQGLQRVSLDSFTPIINGVVTAENQKQAEDRCLGKINRGAEFARAALAMADLNKSLSK